MQTMQLFSHSVRMVLNNFNVALRISTPLIAIMLFGYFVLGDSSTAALGDGSFGGDNLDADFSAGAALSVFLQVVVSLWVAVAWHRFILLEETPSGYVPPFHGNRVLAYFLKGLLLFIIVFAAALVLGFGGGMMFVVETLVTYILGAVLIGVMLVAIIVISARLYVILPAAAVGEPLSLRQAWDATDGMTLPIVLAYILLVLVLMVGGLLIGVVAAFTGIIGTILLIAFNAVATLFSLSLLTTVYGVAIEGRSID